MSADPIEPAAPDFADKVDAALHRFWQGSVDEFESLISDNGDVGAQPCRMLAGLISAHPQNTELPYQIGDYKIIRQLGLGGMSVVYEARQPRSGQSVALKVVRQWSDNEANRLRHFRREVQTLARLKHPQIAALYDAGETSDGRCFLAMELVVGVRLDSFIGASRAIEDYRSPAGRNRLELFCKIARAMNYAHQRGVIHRDLKPSNISICADGNPKVLDFGLARLLDADENLMTQVTDSGRILGTLAYMSPEQARGRSDEIDTRSDVYSLGIILYEMLTGRRPYETSSRAVAEAIRTICDTSPPQPSMSNKSLRGELDAIVMRAIAKEPDLRYQSAAELADDIDRYLSNQPITARPPTAPYQIRKLIARHRTPAALSAALLIVAAAFAVVTVLQKGRIESERDRATAQMNRAERVSEYLTKMLSAFDARAARTSLRLRDILDKAALGVDAELAGEPETAATIHDTLGRGYLVLHQLGAAETHLKKALALRKSVFGEHHTLYAESLNQTARLAVYQQKADLADKLFHEALNIQQEALGAENAAASECQLDAAHFQEVQGNYNEAERLYREAISARKAVLGDHREVADAMHSLAIMLVDAGRYEEGERLLKELIEMRRRLLGNDHDDVARTLTDLGEIYWNQGRYAEAELVYREQIRILRSFGQDSYDLANAITDFANIVLENGDLVEAERLYREGLDMQRRVVGMDHPDCGLNLNEYGKFLVRQGRFEEAEPMLRQVYRLWEGAGENLNAAKAYASRNLASIVAERGAPDEADRLYVDSIDIFRKLFGTTNPGIIDALAGRGQLLERLGKLPEAESLAREALQVALERWPKGDARIGERMMELATILQERGQPEAMSLAQDGYNIISAKLNATHPDYTWALERLASIHHRAGDLPRAKALYQQAIDAERKLPRLRHPILARALGGLGEILLSEGLPREAEPLFQEAVEIFETRLTKTDPRTMAMRDRLRQCRNAVATGQ